MLELIRMTRHLGFTLVEMMVVVAVAAIVLAIGVPAMQGLVQGQRVTATANDLFTAINLTRSEAIRRGGRVDLVPADGADWSSGWTVFIDEDGDLVPDADESILRRQDALRGVEIASNMPPYLSYQGSGRTRQHQSPHSPLFGTFALRAGKQERRVIINMLGRARICNPASTMQPC